MGVKDILPWAQILALIAAAIFAVQSIRSTTDLLAERISQLTAVIAELGETVRGIDGRVGYIERQRAYEKGLRDGDKKAAGG